MCVYTHTHTQSSVRAHTHTHTQVSHKILANYNGKKNSALSAEKSGGYHIK